MLFNSWIFLVFLPLVFGGYFALPQKFRGLFLLIASYVFYGWWKWEFLIIIAFSTILDYYCALRIDESQKPIHKKLWLSLSLGLNLGILFLFKYFYFFIGSADWVQQAVAGHDQIKRAIDFLGKSLPVGISFYTFQTMSYTLDVYHGRAKPEKKPGQFALFVSYFPQLVAGPIERFTHLNDQLKVRQEILLDNLKAGFRLMLYGFFVKMVIADNLSASVSQVFDDPGHWYWYWNLAGVVAFAFQIYADFFGYSLIAQGTAKLFGVELMDNFNRPYLASGINDFWKRWHISLSTWFRDYVYIPLGGNRVSNGRWVFNVSVVFLLSGLWHGANYTFIVWGALHAVYYLIEKYSPVKVSSAPIKQLLTFLAVCLAWVFFRAENFTQAGEVFKGITGRLSGNHHLQTQPVIFLLLLIFGAFELYRRDLRFDHLCNRLGIVQRWAIYIFMLFCVLVLSGSEYQAFIYFRF